MNTTSMTEANLLCFPSSIFIKHVDFVFFQMQIIFLWTNNTAKKITKKIIIPYENGHWPYIYIYILFFHMDIIT